MKLKIVFVIMALFLVGCAQVELNDAVPPAAVQTETMAQEIVVQEATESPPAQEPATPTFTPTETPLPSPTPSPTATVIQPTPTPAFSSFALGDVAAQDRGSVVVEVAWIMVGDRQLLEQQIPADVMLDPEMFADKPVLAWLVFNISNYSGEGFHLHPRRGTVIVNQETIDLSAYTSYTSADENFDGAYLPGEQVVGGGVWFGIEQSDVSEINEIIIRMHGPHFYEEDVYAEEYYIVLDVSNHVTEEMPEYLK